MTKAQIIARLKTEYPELKTGNDYDGYVVMPKTEYDKTIDNWADNELAELSKQAEAEAKATARQAILDRLGLTAEEAQLLLGGN
jgi:hypothetical protein